MSDMTDDLDYGYDDESDMEPPTTWTTKDGREILIADMTTSHLINTVNKFTGRATMTEEIEAMKWELLKRALAK